MINVVRKLFGTKHDRMIKSLRPLVAQINAMEEQLQSLTDEELQAKTPEFKERLANGETTDDLLVEAFAVVKNACRRRVGKEVPRPPGTVTWVEVPYDVQIMGGIVLHRGGIAEMQTGEGKTLVGVMPLYLNALTGRNCQLVTVNDFLAMRDSEWVGSILRWLGLTVGCILDQMNPTERRAQYACDVTYGTNSQFGFDYLRDQGMARDPSELVQRDYFFCIIDEVDSILIDEARTPLIISGPVAVSTHRYDKLKPSVADLVRKQNQLCTRLINEARGALNDDSAEAEAYDDALLKLLRVKLGMPRHRQLMRVLEDPSIQRRLEDLEMRAHSDQNRGMIHDVKETLYFSIDEKAEDTDLTDLGRTTLRPNEPDSFVLPDLSVELQVIEDDEALSPEEKHKRKESAQQLFDERSETIHNISQLLRAYCLYERDDRYLVQDNKVIIVDEFTGRPMPGRRFAEGLHQALEAKEGVTIERETQTLATVTVQNYFRMYDKLAGMTGTAETEANEFRDIYSIDVVVIPTNRPCIRVDEDDRIFRTKQEKFRAIIEEVREAHDRGQPVLLGTVSVQVSEILSRMLRRERIPHTVLNAKNHLHEAEIIEQAGQRDSVTIATNMAGRGTDIRLGDGVKELGGLFVVGSGRHDSRRIDRQLRGRCSRQGDPGTSRFYISLEDDLMRLFGSDRIAGWMERMGLEDGEELSHPWLNRSIEGAQRKVEQQHYSQRKRTLQFDDVVNKQRGVVYGRRHDILTSTDLRGLLFDYVDNAIYDQVENCLLDRKTDGKYFDQDALKSWLNNTFPIGFSDADLETTGDDFEAEKLVAKLTDKVENAYANKESGEEPEELRNLERQIMLQSHDRLWQEHLYAMDGLRQGIYLRSYAQRDPLVEYKQEAFQMFGALIGRINDDICSTMFRSATSLTAFQRLLQNLPQQELHAMFGQFDEPIESGPESAGEEEEAQPSKGVTYVREQPKIGRNDPCPCNSGKKYKKCCGKAG